MAVEQFVVVLVVAAFASVVKSTTGMGYPIIVVPIYSLFAPVVDAVVVVALANLVLNTQLVRQTWPARDEVPTLRAFLVGGVVGSVIGALAVSVLPERVMRLVLVAVIIAFVANRLREPRSLSPERARTWAAPVGGLGGVFQGAAGISGPIVTTWFLSIGLTRDAFVFAICTAFAITGAVQMVVLAGSGLYTTELVVLSVLQLPIVLAMMPFGERLRERLPVERFDQAVIAVLVVSAISLAIRSF